MTLHPTLDTVLAPASAAAVDFMASVHHAPVPEDAPDVAVVLLRPAGAAGRTPWLLQLPDGGHAAGADDGGLGEVLDLAGRTGCAVASVHYRHRADAPYPAAIEDAFAALVWLVDNATDLGLDPDRCVVTGVGAGGGLAAAAALLARDLAWPRILGQLLIRPVLDDRPTARAHAADPTAAAPVDADDWYAYLDGRAGAADVHVYAAPARETALGGLPAAFVEVGSADRVRPEAVDYATRLWLCGGAAELHVWPRGPHLVDAHAHGAGTALEAQDARAQWLRRVLATA